MESTNRLREISRARVQLESDGLAPGNVDTLNELTNPALRPSVITEPIPDNVRNFSPAEKNPVRSRCVAFSFAFGG